MHIHGVSPELLLTSSNNYLLLLILLTRREPSAHISLNLLGHASDTL